jgi:hypothetical protein
VHGYCHLGRWNQAAKVLNFALKAHPLDPDLSHLKRRWWYNKALWLVRRSVTTAAKWFRR